MKTNVCLISSLRKPFSSLLLLILFGLISFGFITKAIGFILVQRETGVLGSYYRSIGVLGNVNDPESGDVSAGIELIKTSPYFAYGDQRRLVSGVLQQTYNSYGRFYWSNSTEFMNAYPKEYWFNVHNTDRWFIGELIKIEEVKDDKRKQPEDKITIGYYLEFRIDTLLAAYPEDARQGQSIGLLFMFKGNEATVPLIEEMEVSQRYLIRGWKDLGFPLDFDWENTNYADLELLPLDDQGLWYIPLANGASIDFSNPDMASIKNDIDILNENLHALGIITTVDMSAMPIFQEASREYYLVEGRWLNHQDDLAGNKVIVVPNDFAAMRGFKLGDELMLTFRPLTDTFLGLIRDGEDTMDWRSYPTYQDTFKIVGLYEGTTNTGILAYIPASSLRPGFASSTKYPYREEGDYSFVLDTPRHETQFTQAYKAPLQELGINLTFLPNNGPAYWAAIDPIRRSSAADILIFGLLMIVALSMAVFIYLMQRKRDYAILRALGVPVKQANGQLILPLLLLGGVGIIIGGLPSWNYALSKAKASLSTIPTPAGVYPSADLSPFFLAGLCVAIFLLLALFSWVGVFLLAHKPVFEILQGETYHAKGGRKRIRTSAVNKPIPSSYSSLASATGSELQETPVNEVNPVARRKYHPLSLSQYVIHHLLRSRVKSFLTLAIALGFTLASGWILRTMERSRTEVDRLYDTTVVQADILLADPTRSSTEETPTKGSGFVYQKTIDSVMNSGFVKSSALEADITWREIGKLDSTETLSETLTGYFPVYAYDNPDAFYSGLADPGSLSFATGWDMERFAQPRTLEEIRKDGVPAIFPTILLDQLQLGVGERIQITDPFVNIFPCVIVGQYSGGRTTTVQGGKIPWIYSPSDSILISLSAMESIERSQIKYTVAHFILDPTKNRELPQFRADMEKVMQASGAGTGDLRFMIWDEELKIVVGQLDKNITLLKTLYPVVIAVSVLIGAGLCFLLLLQATREAAIMRVLGTTRTAVQLALISEPLILSIIGVIIGLAIARFLWLTSDLVPTAPLLTGAGLYLAGVLVGLVIGAISVTNKKPIELLQVKE